jgi:hypothetical protein
MSREPDSAAATRRRRINIAELVALIGVVIAALGLWNSWADRRDAQQARMASETATQRDQGRVDLTGTPRKDGDELVLKDARHDLQDVTISFPGALGVTAQRPLADPVIAAEPLRNALLKDNDHHAGRLPVLVTTRIVDGDAARNVTAIYDLVWVTKRPTFGIGHRSLRLDGLRLNRRGGSQAALDALWAREKATRAR